MWQGGDLSSRAQRGDPVNYAAGERPHFYYDWILLRRLAMTKGLDCFTSFAITKFWGQNPSRQYGQCRRQIRLLSGCRRRRG